MLLLKESAWTIFSHIYLTILVVANYNSIAVSASLHNILSFFYLLWILFKGHRLNRTVVKYIRARTEVECVMKCVDQSRFCRSINFKKHSNCEKNCEFLEDVSSKNHAELLLEDQSYDYYILTNPVRVSNYAFAFKKNCFSMFWTLSYEAFINRGSLSRTWKVVLKLGKFADF